MVQIELLIIKTLMIWRTYFFIITTPAITIKIVIAGVVE